MRQIKIFSESVGTPELATARSKVEDDVNAWLAIAGDDIVEGTLEMKIETVPFARYDQHHHPVYTGIIRTVVYSYESRLDTALNGNGHLDLTAH